MPRIQISGRGRRHGILAQSTGAAAAHGNRRHNLRLGPLALVTLLPFGPIHIIAVRTLPVAERMRVAGRLRCLVLRLHRRRRRRLRRRGHGRARRLTVGAAAAIVPRLIRVIYSIAVLGPVYNSHIMVAHPRHVLAVFIIPCSAAVLHLGCGAIARRSSCRGDGVGIERARWCWRPGVAGALARFCDLVAVREVAAMTREATSACATDWRAAAAAN